MTISQHGIVTFYSYKGGTGRTMALANVACLFARRSRNTGRVLAMFIGAIDQGTTSTRFMVYDANGREVARRQLEHEQILPRPGWVEHDAIEIAARVDEVIVGALRTAGVSGRDLAAVGITNQRETTVVWDRRTGRPWHNAIVW